MQALSNFPATSVCQLICARCLALQCLMELFVFVQLMDGGLDHLQVKLLSKDVDRICSSTCNANEAYCHNIYDRERLLGIIESGCGGFASFNSKVRIRVPLRAWRQQSSNVPTISTRCPFGRCVLSSTDYRPRPNECKSRSTQSSRASRVRAQPSMTFHLSA